mmetsp:Transcript_4677/g.6618  ORF Transcript_4677/g.6618 Transcript_4677/m.6618 type:complete len:257 (-) Transcript_4677:174-944(-)
MCTNKFRWTNLYNSTLFTRNTSANGDVVVLVADQHNRELLDSLSFIAHSSSHFKPLQNTGRCSRRTDRSVLSVRLGTVCHRSTFHTPSTNATLESLTRCGSGNIYKVSDSEKLLSLQLLSSLKRAYIRDLEFLEMLHSFNSAMLPQVLSLWPGNGAFSAFLICKLNCVVTIRLLCLYLSNYVSRLESNNSDRMCYTLFIVIRRHSCLGSHHSHFYRFPIMLSNFILALSAAYGYITGQIFVGRNKAARLDISNHCI